MTEKEQIEKEIDITINDLKSQISSVKKLAISEAWKMLQLIVSRLVRIIESTAVSWSGPEKKELAMSIVEQAYDKLFLVIDIPMIPSLLESYLHKYIKKILLLMVSSTIDATVTTFREIGLFVENYKYQGTVIIGE